MTEETEIRLKLPRGLHAAWSAAAERRGLTLRSFVVAVVSGKLVGSNEITTQPAPAATPAPAEPAQPVVKSPPLSHWPNLTRADLLANGYSEAEADEALGVKPTTVQDVIADWPDDD